MTISIVGPVFAVCSVFLIAGLLHVGLALKGQANGQGAGSEALIDYTNWRGERRWRRIVPLRIVFQNSEWHPAPQWIMHAVDVETGAIREFAMKDIHEWKPIA
ncbi:WYL domain-containing protein [Rhodopseudomonas palustris]|nr:WYL domain-containing protein [Rhodopseudomonas palustris]